MGKEKNAAGNLLFWVLRELFQVGIYKRSQGRIARQVTWGAMFVVIGLGAWRLHDFLINYGPKIQLTVPTVVVLAGAWVAYRLVNMPSFADFLIAVEAEMNKVSWPTVGELWRSLLVVLFSIGFLVVVLAAYDLFWRLVLHFLSVLH
jgi:preprotein translocase subunit SecE